MTGEEILAVIKYYASLLPGALRSFENAVECEYKAKIVESSWSEVRRIYDSWCKWKELLEEINDNPM